MRLTPQAENDHISTNTPGTVLDWWLLRRHWLWQLPVAPIRGFHLTDPGFLNPWPSWPCGITVDHYEVYKIYYVNFYQQYIMHIEVQKWERSAVNRVRCHIGTRQITTKTSESEL